MRGKIVAFKDTKIKNVLPPSLWTDSVIEEFANWILDATSTLHIQDIEISNYGVKPNGIKWMSFRVYTRGKSIYIKGNIG